MTGQGTLKLGIVGTIPGGPRCPECDGPVPAGQALCPTCGHDRGLEGAPYPARRFKRFAWVAAQRGISGTGKAVLYTLATHDGPKSKGIFPSHETLAAEAGFTARAVGRILMRLREDGWVTWEQHWSRGQLTNRYRIQQAEAVLKTDTESVLKTGTESA